MALRPLLVFLAALVGLAVAAAPAHAVTIGFDDLTAPPSGGGQGYTVNSDYAAQGVTFNDVDAYSYPAGFPHSPDNAVEQCVAIELCQAPIRADFTTGQDSVRVWVGYSDPLAAPRVVTLKVFDGAGTELASDQATLPANPADTPVQTPLEVDPPAAAIRRAEVSTDDGYTAGVVVDDLEFSTVGPPPPCNTTQPASIGLVQPAANLVVQRNLFPLSGFVNDSGATITNAFVRAEGSSTRQYQIYPGTIDANGGSFGTVNVGELLSPGVNQVSVRATTCAGTAQSATRQVTYDPIDPATRFEQLGTIEVSQGVQAPGNSVPLVAATQTTGKRTFARVYLKLAGGEAAIGSVRGTLIARDPNDQPLPGPLSVDSLNAVKVEEASTPESVRGDFTKSLNFELPREWQQQGRVHLELDSLSIEGARTNLQCQGCDNALANGGNPAFVTFQTVPPVRIWLVSVPWEPTPGATPNMPRQFDIDMLASWLRRAYPTAEVRDTQMSLPAMDEPPGFVDEDDDGVDENRDGFLCDDVWDELSEWTQSMQAQHANTRYYGVVSDTGGNFMRGCAQIGGRFGAGPAGPSGGWDNDGTYGDWYGGHEIGHMYDRKHPGMCEETDDDDDFPYPGGLIGSATLDHQGLDAGDATLGPPMQLYDWRQGWSDVMTYCDKQWISGYTYRGILGDLCEREAANCPNRAELATRRCRPAARRNRGRALAVNGSIDLGSGKLSLTGLSVMKGLTLTERPRKSSYAIELSGRSGKTLARYPIAPKPGSDLPAGSEVAAIDDVVRFAKGTRRVTILEGKKTLRSVAVSANAPRVRVLAPKGKGKLGKRTTVRWKATDRDRDDLTYSLLYSPGRGADFLPVAAGLRGRSYRADLRRLPGGKRARFRVVANDGVLTGTASSRGKLQVKAKKPRVHVTAPATGASFNEGAPLQLAATVDDLQDATIPARRIVWRSDRSGEIGRGSAVVAQLAPGNHEITVTATNSAGRKASRSVEISVVATPPTIDGDDPG